MYKRWPTVGSFVEATDRVGGAFKIQLGIAMSRNASLVHAAKSGAVSGIPPN
jgi:hypothetical protein